MLQNLRDNREKINRMRGITENWRDNEQWSNLRNFVISLLKLSDESFVEKLLKFREMNYFS